MKSEVSIAQINSSWLIGDGSLVNFSNDTWCGDPLSGQLHLNHQVARHLTTKVLDFISDGEWEIPAFLQTYFPTLANLVSHVTISTHQASDRLMWKHSNNGDLPLKEAYGFKSSHSQPAKLAKAIGSTNIPPSKSMVSWRLMYGKIPTDDQLVLRGMSLVSVCNCCFKNQETASHLFFHCNFASQLWNWLASILNRNVQVGSIEEVWSLTDRGWSPQCKIVIQAILVNIIHTIWFFRNQLRFSAK